MSSRTLTQIQSLKIKGIGPVVTQRLNAAGIYSRLDAMRYVQNSGCCELLKVLGVGPRRGLRIMRTIGVTGCYLCDKDLEIRMLSTGYNSVNEGRPCANLKPQLVERQTVPPILIKPVVIPTQSIPEVKAEPKPSDFKTWGPGVQAWEVSEDDYVRRQFEKEKSRLSANIRYWEQQIAELNPKQEKKRADFEFSIDLTKRRLAKIEGGDESNAFLEHGYRNNYNQLVKEAIKHGESVPDAVIAQKPEFEVARTARRRYEKGLHTSFANRSAAINEVMFLEKGYKVKRQDGKEIVPVQIKEIDQGVSEIEESVGTVKDIMQKSDLTIAHTSGKYPFLGSAGGIFHPFENTITTGVVFLGIKPIRSLGHEWGHWLDYAGGSAAEEGYHEFYSNGKSTRRVKSPRRALSNDEQYSNPLFERARDTMSNESMLRRLQNPSLQIRPLTEEEQKEAKELNARLGFYWRDPREIWARLVEQYVAETRGGGIASESPDEYHTLPAYWTKENFDALKPMIKAEIERRIAKARGT